MWIFCKEAMDYIARSMQELIHISSLKAQFDTWNIPFTEDIYDKFITLQKMSKIRQDSLQIIRKWYMTNSTIYVTKPEYLITLYKVYCTLLRHF